MIAARRRASLKKHLDEISRWAAEGKDDETIAATLGSSASSIQSFRSRAGIPHYKRRDGTAQDKNSASSHPASYEGVLERVREECGTEQWMVWFDPAIADDPAYQRCREQRRVSLRLDSKRMTVALAPPPDSNRERGA